MVRPLFSSARVADFPDGREDLFRSAASARLASNDSSREDASSCLARIDARRAARWISPSSCALAGLSPADSSRNSVLIWITVRRLFSSCATKLAVLFAASRSWVRAARSVAVVCCLCFPEPLALFFRTVVLVPLAVGVRQVLEANASRQGAVAQTAQAAAATEQASV